MSAGEEMVREQLDRIIARTELRVEQQCIHANALAPHGDESKRARSELALLLAGLAKLKTLSEQMVSAAADAHLLPAGPISEKQYNGRGPQEAWSRAGHRSQDQSVSGLQVAVLERMGR
jgi:hypothetical protein